MVGTRSAAANALRGGAAHTQAHLLARDADVTSQRKEEGQEPCASTRLHSPPAWEGGRGSRELWSRKYQFKKHREVVSQKKQLCFLISPNYICRTLSPVATRLISCINPSFCISLGWPVRRIYFNIKDKWILMHMNMTLPSSKVSQHTFHSYWTKACDPSQPCTKSICVPRVSRQGEEVPLYSL